MLVYVISGEVSDRKTSKIIDGQLDPLVLRKNRRLIDSTNKNLPHKLKKEKPHFVILHKTNGETKKIEREIRKKSPKTHVLYALDGQWESVIEILSAKLAVA